MKTQKPSRIYTATVYGLGTLDHGDQTESPRKREVYAWAKRASKSRHRPVTISVWERGGDESKIETIYNY